MNRANCHNPHSGEDSINALATMLDYAIIEGAELRLPVFVFMLRAARLELMNNLNGDEMAVAQLARQAESG